MLGLNPAYSVLAVLLAGLLAAVLGRRAGHSPSGHTRVDTPAGPIARVSTAVAAALDDRWAPTVAGLITGLGSWFVWGSLERSAVVHDESAYLLQAELFARLRWTATGLPLPEFFEQLYLLVSPVLASKYPPGTSLLLAPGVAIGLPGLPIVLVNALTGGLVLALARRVADGAVALVAWAIWASSFPVLYFHAMYLSEVPTSLAWVVTFWGLLRWRESGRSSHLTLAALALGVCAITRPLTAVALALVVAVVLLQAVIRDRQPLVKRVRPLAPFVVAGVLAAATLSLWSWRTTGDPRLSPLTVYTRTYVPFDGLGFGASPTEPPSSRLPWDQRFTSQAFFDEHQRHVPSALPTIALARTRMIARDVWYDWRGGLALFALLGLASAAPAVWVGLAALVSQFAFYLLYAHPPTWSLYYIETLPVLALVTAIGIVRVWSWTVNRAAVLEIHRARILALASLLLLVAALHPIARTVRMVRAQIAADHRFYDSFARLLPSRPEGAIVFVRYARGHNDGLTLIRNVPELASAPVWTVYDRGAENARLRALAPTRAAYLFDEATWTMRPLD